MIAAFKAWLKRWLGIVELEAQNAELQKRCYELQNEFTKASARKRVDEKEVKKPATWEGFLQAMAQEGNHEH